MSELIYIPDHADRSIRFMASQYREAERLPAFVRVLAGGTQEAEDAAFGTLTGDNPTDAPATALGDDGSASKIGREAEHRSDFVPDG